MNLTQWKLIYIQINCCSANNLLVIPVEQDLICFLKKACARHFLERNWLCVVWFCHFARIVISINFSEENCINVWNSGLILKDGKMHFVLCGLIQFSVSLFVFFCSYVLLVVGIGGLIGAMHEIKIERDDQFHSEYE